LGTQTDGLTDRTRKKCTGSQLYVRMPAERQVAEASDNGGESEKVPALASGLLKLWEKRMRRNALVERDGI
jgi:hypothetical protein